MFAVLLKGEDNYFPILNHFINYFRIKNIKTALQLEHNWAILLLLKPVSISDLFISAYIHIFIH